MGFIDSTKKSVESAKTLTENVGHLTKNKLSDKTPKKRETTYTIKEAREDINNCYYRDYRDVLLGIANDESYYYWSILKETNEFYNKMLRNGIANTMVDSISARIMDNFSIKRSSDGTKANDNIIFRFDNQDYVYNLNNIDFINMANYLIWYGKAYAMPVINKNAISFKVLEPFKVDLTKDRAIYKYYKGNVPYYVEYTEELVKTYSVGGKKQTLISTEINIFGKIPIFKMELEQKVTSISTTELVLMYTQAITLMQKEIKNGSNILFMSREYRENYSIINEFYELVNTPELNIKDDATNKPLFEVYSPQLRATDINTIIEKLTELIAQNMRIDKTTLGLDVQNYTTATEIVVRNQKTIQTINKIKQQVEYSINNFFKMFASDFYIEINPYKETDKQTQINYLTTALGNGIIDYYEAVKDTHDNLTNEEIEVMALTIMFRKGVMMTPLEIERSRELGILPEDTMTTEDDVPTEETQEDNDPLELG